MESVSIVPVAAAAFVATNLDNFFLFLSFLTMPSVRIKSVFLGFITGMLILIGISATATLLPALIPVKYLGLLGIIPITVGIRQLIATSRGLDPSGQISAPTVSSSAFSAVVLTQISNGSDTIITLVPLIADSMPGAVVLILATFVAMSLLLWRTARRVHLQPAVAALTKRYGHFLAPVILILVGSYILANTATDLLPG